tara:strand:- start:51 stop:272 length:222 start_codon:yes stop_codon:yes gene_type:complete
MIKFVLMMQMCFTLTQTCLPPIKSVELYDTHKDCSLAGYKNGYAIIESRPDYEVNKQKAMITFWCIEQITKET